VRDFFDTPEPPRPPSESRQKEEVKEAPRDQRPCEGCQRYAPNILWGSDVIGVEDKEPAGFGRCAEITHTRSIYVSPSAPCMFNPSRYK
jgi:hypothetical protein